jgi:hypothetical protein
VLPSPGVDLRELGMAGGKLSHEGLCLTGLLEALVDPQGEGSGRAHLDTLRFLLQDQGGHIRLERGEEARRHLELDIQLGHGPWHEVLVAPLVEELQLCQIVSQHISVQGEIELDNLDETLALPQEWGLGCCGLGNSNLRSHSRVLLKGDM